VASALVLFGYSVSLLSLPHRMRTAPPADLGLARISVATQFSMVAVLIIVTTYVVAAYYCLEALHGERRDRSILFWKSLPVSDRITVLSKALVPLALAPALIVVLTLATQALMLLARTSILLTGGAGGYAVSTRPPLVQMTVVLFYGLVVHALWHAPIYAWFLLVSGWAKRAPFLWAVLPPLALAAIERITLGTSTLGNVLSRRVAGATGRAFTGLGTGNDRIFNVSQIDPLRFLGSPGLWLGLAFAAACLAAAVRLRRYREPI
jgi:ABC-2 type transport system permease protein